MGKPIETLGRHILLIPSRPKFWALEALPVCLLGFYTSKFRDIIWNILRHVALGQEDTPALFAEV